MTKVLRHIEESVYLSGGKKMAISVYLESKVAVGVFPEERANAIYKQLVGCDVDIYGACGCLCRSGTEEEEELRQVERACKSYNGDYPEVDSRLKCLKMIEVPADSEYIGVELGGHNIVAFNDETKEIPEFDPAMVFSIEEYFKNTFRNEFVVFNGSTYTYTHQGVGTIEEELRRFTYWSGMAKNK